MDATIYFFFQIQTLKVFVMIRILKPTYYK